MSTNYDTGNSRTDDCGDHVVLINTGDIALPGDEWTKRVYFHHTGFSGGASWTLAWELHRKDPTQIMHKAVYNAMKGTLQRRYAMQRLHVFADAEVPADLLSNVTSQLRQSRLVPRRLDHIAAEEVAAFPKIMDFPKDYVLR